MGDNAAHYVTYLFFLPQESQARTHEPEIALWPLWRVPLDFTRTSVSTAGSQRQQQEAGPAAGGWF